MRVVAFLQVEQTEEDVVGPGLAGLHRLVAGAQVAGADDRLRLQRLDRFLQRRFASFDVNAVGAGAAHDAAVAEASAATSCFWAIGTSVSAIA